MNPDASRDYTKVAYVAAVLGAFLIIGALVLTMQHFTKPAPVDEEKATTRLKALAELRAAEAEALVTTAWIDKGKGVVRLRVEDAMKTVERDRANNAVAARSNLMERVAKATAV